MLISVTAILVFSAAFAGCGHTHEWESETCMSPKTCISCGKIDGNALGHSWTAATCTSPKICARCGETDGEALGHSWVEMSAYQKDCEVCGAVEIDQSKLPVKLNSLDPCTGPDYSSTATKSDIYGNTFYEGLQLNHMYSNRSHGAEYVLNREYETFTARIMIHSRRDDFEVKLIIYVDGVLAYDSGVMTKKTQPIDISINVTNAMFLKIETLKTEGAGNVMISEPLLHH